MKGWSRLLVVAILLGAAVLASAQEQRIYPIPEDTQCWDCHAPGLWDPDMDPNFEILPPFTNVSVGDTFEFEAELVNIWRAEQVDMFVTLDISNATSLRFIGGKDPESFDTKGSITVEQGTNIAISDPIHQREFTDRQRVVIPDGTTDLRISLIPDDRSDTTGPDLSLRIYDKFATEKLDDRRPPTPIQVEEAGRGGVEVFHVSDASAVAGFGFGNWTIEAMYQIVRGSGAASQANPQPTQIPYTIRVESWFNVTGETLAIVNKPGPVQPGGGIEIFTWHLTAIALPKPGEDVLLIANVTTYYEHQSASDPDEGPMRVEARGPVKAVGEDRIEIGVQRVGPAPGAVVTGVSMAAISEAIGYAAAMQLILSVWTGGMFGKASRRQLNVVFGSARRRVAFHNFLSYGIIVTAIAHTVIFVIDAIEPNYPWQLGLIWGGLGILCMLGLGVTGALQVPMIRRWNYGTWRWLHLGLSIGAIVFTIVHMLLDGQNFSFVQDALGYKDPLSPPTRV